jgi:hypothetical protein
MPELFIDSQNVTNITTQVKTIAGNLYTYNTSTTMLFKRLNKQEKILCCSTVDGSICGKTNINVLCELLFILFVKIIT